jgi:hypothetical protein
MSSEAGDRAGSDGSAIAATHPEDAVAKRWSTAHAVGLERQLSMSQNELAAIAEVRGMPRTANDGGSDWLAGVGGLEVRRETGKE